MGDQLAAGRTAAPIGFGQLDKLEAVDHLQQVRAAASTRPGRGAGDRGRGR